MTLRFRSKHALNSSTHETPHSPPPPPSPPHRHSPRHTPQVRRRPQFTLRFRPSDRRLQDRHRLRSRTHPTLELHPGHRSIRQRRQKSQPNRLRVRPRPQPALQPRHRPASHRHHQPLRHPKLPRSTPPHQLLPPHSTLKLHHHQRRPLSGLRPQWQTKNQRRHPAERFAALLLRAKNLQRARHTPLRLRRANLPRLPIPLISQRRSRSRLGNSQVQHRRAPQCVSPHSLRLQILTPPIAPLRGTKKAKYPQLGIAKATNTAYLCTELSRIHRLLCSCPK